jgi:hypothetical protein
MLFTAPYKLRGSSWWTAFPSFSFLRATRSPTIRLSYVDATGTDLQSVAYQTKLHTLGLLPELGFRCQFATLARFDTSLTVQVPQAETVSYDALPRRLHIGQGWDVALGFVHFGCARVYGLAHVNALLYAGLCLPLPTFGVAAITGGEAVRDPDAQPAGLSAHDLRLKLEGTLLDESWPLNRVVVDHSLDAQLRRISPEQQRWMAELEAREDAHEEGQKRTAAEDLQAETRADAEALQAFRKLQAEPQSKSPS